MAASAVSERERGIRRKSERGGQQDPERHAECVCVVRGPEGSGKQEVAGARVRARRPHALLPTGRRWKTTGRSPWWAGLVLPGWAATVPGQVGFAR